MQNAKQAPKADSKPALFSGILPISRNNYKRALHFFNLGTYTWTQAFLKIKKASHSL